jgi:hypothetical protein
MSYLNNARLVFSGRFQADVSTVNNDVRHFDNATFDPAFQKWQTKEDWGGWWNPTGSGAFRLLDCRIRMVGYADGATTADAAKDPAIGMLVGGAADRTSGKLVDLDPQWQMASAPWGLEVRLTDGEVAGFFHGRYKPHAFRDLWFGRMLDPTGAPGGGDGAASAVFQSVLKDVTWAADLKGSRALADLKAAGEGRLSIRLTTFSYIDQPRQNGGFTLGTVSGVIGPQLADEPESFVLGRRFAPANGSTSWNGCSYFTAWIDAGSRTLLVDLGNAIQLAYENRDPTKGDVVPAGALNDVGTLRIGILKNPGIVETAPANDDNFLVIGEIPYLSPGWALDTGGLASFKLNAEQFDLAQNHPLALAAASPLNAGNATFNGKYGQIAIRETIDGLFVEAEPSVHRIDAPGKSEATIYALRYGAPLADAQVAFSQLGKVPSQGGGETSGTHVPPADIPNIGVPTDALKIAPHAQTDHCGRAKLPLEAEDPKKPRKYIDGQLYLVDFRLPGQSDQARSMFDYIIVHVRDAYPVPETPTWERDVAPIFTQYANLYPIMSQQLVDLADPRDVKRHAKILRLAFDQPMSSPNHMPVTRDLSQGKREMILKFLDQVVLGEEPTLEAAVAAAATPEKRPAAPAKSEDVAHSGGKTVAAQNFATATGIRIIR